MDLVPLGDVGRVDGGSTDPGTLGRRDLVAHEGEQRRDDDRGPRASGAQERGGHEVHGRLAPAGALDHECTAVLAHERVDRCPLVVAQHHVLTADETAQRGLGLGTQVFVVAHDHRRRGAGDRSDRRTLRRASSGASRGTPLCGCAVCGVRLVRPRGVAGRFVEVGDVLVRVVVARLVLCRRVLCLLDGGLASDRHVGDAWFDSLRFDGSRLWGRSLVDRRLVRVVTALVSLGELVGNRKVHELAGIDRRRPPGG